MRASPVAAVAAGSLTANGRLIAAGAINATHGFITSALKKSKSGMGVEEIVESHPKRKKGANPGATAPAIPGYNRPIAKGDLQVTTMERIGRELGFERGEHLTLGFEISDFLDEKYGECMNSAGHAAAFLSDQGINTGNIRTF